MAMARQQRDGWSLERIASEADVVGLVSKTELERALRLGHQLLAEAIAKGEEPEESLVEVPVDEETV